MLLRALLPPGARAVEVDGDVEAAGEGAAPVELAAVAAARPERRAEFLTGRWCAREALRALGLPAAPVPPGVRRAPVWPAGVVGSITHCAGYRAAVVAHRRDVVALGVDATPHEPLPERVLAAVADPDEREHLAELAPLLPGVHADRALFSAKESLIKAWSALDPDWAGFSAFRVRLDAQGAFSAHGPRGALLAGRWGVAAGLLGTAVVVPAVPAVPAARTRPARVSAPPRG